MSRHRAHVSECVFSHVSDQVIIFAFSAGAPYKKCWHFDGKMVLPNMIRVVVSSCSLNDPFIRMVLLMQQQPGKFSFWSSQFRWWK